MQTLRVSVCKTCINMLVTPLHTPGYNLYRTSVKEKKRRHGVGIAVVKSSDFVIVLYQPERLIPVDIVVRGCKIRITSAQMKIKCCLRKRELL